MYFGSFLTPKKLRTAALKKDCMNYTIMITPISDLKRSL